MDRNRFAAMVVLIGSLLLALGAFLPWVRIYTGFGAVSISGLELDGPDAKWMLGFGVVAALFAARVFVMQHRYTGIDAFGDLILSGIVMYIAAWNIENIPNTADVQTSAAIGVWLTLVAGVVLLFGAVIGLIDAVARRRDSSVHSGTGRSSFRKTWRYYQSGQRIPSGGTNNHEPAEGNGSGSD